jgi:type I restriction enzyme S subunit
MRVTFPSVEEQEKIADFLSSLDSKIIQIGNELSAVKEFKKELLQGMFVWVCRVYIFKSRGV